MRNRGNKIKKEEQEVQNTLPLKSGGKKWSPKMSAVS